MPESRIALRFIRATNAKDVSRIPLRCIRATNAYRFGFFM